jgi:hypothetical protein
LTNTDHRAFVLVDKDAFTYFHREWNRIDKMWPHFGDPDHWDAIRGLRDFARNELRKEIVERHSLGFVGNYLVPV